MRQRLESQGLRGLQRSHRSWPRHDNSMVRDVAQCTAMLIRFAPGQLLWLIDVSTNLHLTTLERCCETTTVLTFLSFIPIANAHVASTRYQHNNPRTNVLSFIRRPSSRRLLLFSTSFKREGIERKRTNRQVLHQALAPNYSDKYLRRGAVRRTACEPV